MYSSPMRRLLMPLFHLRFSRPSRKLGPILCPVPFSRFGRLSDLRLVYDRCNFSWTKRQSLASGKSGTFYVPGPISVSNRPQRLKITLGENVTNSVPKHRESSLNLGDNNKDDVGLVGNQDSDGLIRLALKTEQRGR